MGSGRIQLMKVRGGSKILEGGVEGARILERTNGWGLGFWGKGGGTVNYSVCVLPTDACRSFHFFCR